MQTWGQFTISEKFWDKFVISQKLGPIYNSKKSEGWLLINEDQDHKGLLLHPFNVVSSFKEYTYNIKVNK